MASMTPSEMRDVKETRTETAREIGNVTALGDLKMPTVPMSGNQDQQKINELVVANLSQKIAKLLPRPTWIVKLMIGAVDPS